MTVIHNHLRIFRNYSHKVRVLPLKIFFLKKSHKIRRSYDFFFLPFFKFGNENLEFICKSFDNNATTWSSSITMRQFAEVLRQFVKVSFFQKASPYVAKLLRFIAKNLQQLISSSEKVQFW